MSEHGMLADLVTDIRRKDEREKAKKNAVRAIIVPARRTDLPHPQLDRFVTDDGHSINRTLLSSLMHAYDGLSTYERWCFKGYALYGNGDDWKVTPAHGVVCWGGGTVTQWQILGDSLNRFGDLDEMHNDPHRPRSTFVL